MLKRINLIIAMTFTCAAFSFAQGTIVPAKKTTPAAKTQTTQTETKSKSSASMTMLETFNALLDGIRAANAKAVSDFYWRSPELVTFNSNGTITKGWEQMRKNRESSYAKLKDVVLDTREVHATMLGRDAGIVQFLWTQSQTSDGMADSASGRTTLVFRHYVNGWKIIHAHISPDSPDPSRVLQSEQAQPSTDTPKATP